MGRAYACWSPSNRTVPSAKAATGGTKRITVPARPQSIVPPALNDVGGVTCHWSALSSMRTPRVRNASLISWVSRASRPPVITDGPVASAAKINARFVSDLEAGRTTVAVIGAGASGAAHGRSPDTPQILSTFSHHGVLHHHHHHHRLVRI